MSQEIDGDNMNRRFYNYIDFFIFAVLLFDGLGFVCLSVVKPWQIASKPHNFSVFFGFLDLDAYHFKCVVVFLDLCQKVEPQYAEPFQIGTDKFIADYIDFHNVNVQQRAK